MSRNPLPLYIRELRDSSQCKFCPYDRRLLVFNKIEHLGIVAIDTNKVIVDSLTPCVKVRHVTIICLELLARLLAVD